MEKSGKRGKIPQSDWPRIMARYEAGETLSSIARTYDCSPPAISYIVSRSREKTASDVVAQAAVETQLIKASPNGAVDSGSTSIEPTVEMPAPVAEIRREPAAEPLPVAAASGTPATPTNGAPVNGDQRRRLHLSLGNGTGNGSAGGNGNGSHTPGNGNGHEPPAPNFVVQRQAQPQGGAERNGQRPFEAAPRPPAPLDAVHNPRDLFAIPEGRPAAQQPRDAEALRKENSAFIDQELRSRVDGDIAAFLAAFDAALAADTQESRFGLREATDRLLRAGARTRIELERLEARVPLSPRDTRGEPNPAAWRYR
jgi:hypothetical protein